MCDINNYFLGINYAQINLLFEVLVLSSFISMNTTIFYTFSNETAMIQFELHRTDHNLNIVVDQSNLQHVMPLAIPSEDIPLKLRNGCDAGIRCRIGCNRESLITCKSCLLKYHPHCIGGEDHSEESCGCSDIPVKSERLLLPEILHKG